MNKPFFMRFVFLILLILICMIAMVFMAVERESVQEIVHGSAIVPVIESFPRRFSYLHLLFLTRHQIKAGQVKLLITLQTPRSS